MKITVLGATGGIGRRIVALALADGHDVTAVVRDPARLAVDHDRLDVVRGNALDAASLEPHVAGRDAVLSGIGAAARHDPLRPASTSAAAAVEAMRAGGTRRILTVSAGPLNRTGAGENALVRAIGSKILWKILREPYEDLERMERILADSGLDWTAVRPPRLTNGSGTGYRTAVEASTGRASITRVAAARAMLDLVDDTSTFGHAVGISH